MEVQGYVELHTTFLDGEATSTITIKYIVFNDPSSYNLILGRSSLNKLKTVVSMTHLKLKLPSPERKIITMKVDQKIARKCYENSLRSRRGTYMITTRAKQVGIDFDYGRHLESIRYISEVHINERIFKMGAALHEELKSKLKEVLQWNMDAFAWSVTDMPNIDPNFLCHRLNLEIGAKPVTQRRRRHNEKKAASN